jgi:predicted transcriptional regulator
MRIKRIRIKSNEQWMQDLLELARDLDKGRLPKRKSGGEYFESLDAVRNILTDKRLELWRAIRDKKPDSISTLAKMVNRSFKVVHRDLAVLQTVGLITFKKSKGKRGDLQSPIALVDELQVAVA